MCAEFCEIGNCCMLWTITLNMIFFMMIYILYYNSFYIEKTFYSVYNAHTKCNIILLHLWYIFVNKNNLNSQKDKSVVFKGKLYKYIFWMRMLFNRLVRENNSPLLTKLHASQKFYRCYNEKMGAIFAQFNKY